MTWKKSLPFFVWQSIICAKNIQHFQKIWAYKNRWTSSFQPGRNSVVDELPWLNFAAIDFLKQQNLSKSTIFEFGGGGSTLFFCKNAAQVSTVEDNEGWFATLTETVASKGYENWQGFFVSPEPFSVASRRDPANPADFASGAPGLENMSFEKYARTIDSFPEGYFDVILVDGRARTSCMQQALPHLKIGGLLVVDNTERAYYLTQFQDVIERNFKIELNGRFPVGYTPDFTQTTILRRIN